MARNHGWPLLVALAGAAGAGCIASDDAAPLGSAPWGPYVVSVESRPTPPRAGNNEVVVIISGEHHQPVFDAVVTLRAQPEADWVQAIEDGHVGVYRRAINFGHQARTTLEVHLRREGQETTIPFPVVIGTPP